MSEIKLRNQKTKAITIIGISTVFFIALSIFIGYQLINKQYLPVDPSDESYIIVSIPDNSTARQIAGILLSNDLIRSESAFLNYCRQNDIDNQLQAGNYKLSRSQSVEEIAYMIARGKVVTIAFTIPEGYTVKQIGELLIKRGICKPEEWNRLIVKDYKYSFLEGIPFNENRLEGYLFPDTYLISENTTAEQIIRLMLSTFENVWQTEFAALADEKGLDKQDIVTLASLIEREARVASERSKISGVIYNRLNKGMLLQIDASVIYALGEEREVVFHRDLRVDSPYNTYKYYGLPPGPIASPGRASIEAAINPDEHSYFYYVAKGDGSHYFSKTYAEHLQAVNRYIN